MTMVWSKAQSQRDCVIQPRHLRTSYPRLARPIFINPNGVVAASVFGVVFVFVKAATLSGMTPLITASATGRSAAANSCRRDQ